MNLGAQDLASLERLYAQARVFEVPTGSFRGAFLRWLDAPGARHPLWRPALALMFQLSPFGVDFDSHRWFFGSARLQVGAFTAARVRSCWRDTETVALEYQVSRLPGRVKAMLYDEVKPLSDGLCLGLGGLVLGGQRQATFFFALERGR